jgi:hypothetical protein
MGVPKVCIFLIISLGKGVVIDAVGLSTLPFEFSLAGDAVCFSRLRSKARLVSLSSILPKPVNGSLDKAKVPEEALSFLLTPAFGKTMPSCLLFISLIDAAIETDNADDADGNLLDIDGSMPTVLVIGFGDTDNFGNRLGCQDFNDELKVNLVAVTVELVSLNK